MKSGGCGGDRTPGSSQKKMHKKSPKKYPGSSSKGRKARDRSEKQTRRHLRLDSSDNDEASERESDDERAESPFFTGSRQAASKQAGSAITIQVGISFVFHIILFFTEGTCPTSMTATDVYQKTGQGMEMFIPSQHRRLMDAGLEVDQEDYSCWR